ncbi:MAG: tRNA guanosine(34) transglycosylase Tgt [Pelagibacteraceae bacterium TMED237]|nr:tRNA guanosine(34) transglycosylase Tgt [Candidatus Neomarinimicrobiota bacterium]OUW96305.1 MAG: tRNA guanosine(34) transglycosylase Tgt [Pelagibacteraceae bacterium TMED237]
MKFKITAECKKSAARTGELYTDHGILKTPFFMPVGTYATVKSQSSEEISSLPSSILLSNTYHLYLRPGIDILKNAQGLHNFMKWKGVILTDSGGYQIYSLENHRKINSEGVTFKSHYDGSIHEFTPEKIIDIQRIIGSDFMMVLDVCPSGEGTVKEWEKAVNLTTKWAYQSYEHYQSTKPIYSHSQSIIPIIQGGTNIELRQKSARELLDLNMNNYAIGGLAVGEPKKDMLSITSLMNNLIPQDKSRYLMGVGTPSDLIECVKRGVDMFDCVIPTRNARNAQLFTDTGKLNIRNACYKDDHSAIDINSKSVFSQKYTKAYLHHLFRMNEILGIRIATAHNLHFYINLMKTIREKIRENLFDDWSKKYLDVINS